jgi:hypothetical protein
MFLPNSTMEITLSSFNILGKTFVFTPDADGQLPVIVLVCGHCGGGTTALSNNFVVAGIEAHMQPMKSIQRVAAGLEERDMIPPIITFHDPLVLIKETFGSSHGCEVFNPVKMLVEAGYPAHRIKVVGMVREPIATIDSWHRLWGRADTEMFLNTYCQMKQIWDYCAKVGSRYLPYTPEIIRSNDPETVVGNLMSQLDIPIRTDEICDWHGKPPFGNDPKWPNLHFYDEPPERFIHGVRTRGGYTYKDTTTEHRDVPDETHVIYEEHRTACERALQLQV